MIADTRLNLLGWAAALLVAGLLMLLFNFGFLARFDPLTQYIGAGLFAAGGLAFFGGYLVRREQWGRLVPGWMLLALAGVILLSTLPEADRRWMAALPFLGLAAAFTHIWLIKRGAHWWAIIPGGFMLVLGLVLAVSIYVARLETLGALLFLGMGLVFFLLYLLGGRPRQWWALIPGTVLLLFGIYVFSLNNPIQATLLNWWPLLLIVPGIALGWVAFSRRPPKETLSVNSAPAAPRPDAAATPPAGAALPAVRGTLGEYSQPAPGASVEVLPDYDDERT